MSIIAESLCGGQKTSWWRFRWWRDDRKPYCFLLISNFNGIPSRSLSGEEISRRNTEELRSFKGLFT